MKKELLIIIIILGCTVSLYGQKHSSDQATIQVKVDFLEPLVNQGVIVRADHIKSRHLGGLFLGGAGRVSEFDNAQYDTYQDETKWLIGIEYQYFLSREKVNRGFYVGADLMYANRVVSSKISSEASDPQHTFTPGVWFGWLWKPFESSGFIVDLTIVHPRYDFGSIKKVSFQTVPTPYEPENLLNFLGPWSIGWRF